MYECINRRYVIDAWLWKRWRQSIVCQRWPCYTTIAIFHLDYNILEICSSRKDKWMHWSLVAWLNMIWVCSCISIEKSARQSRFGLPLLVFVDVALNYWNDSTFIGFSVRSTEHRTWTTSSVYINISSIDYAECTMQNAKCWSWTFVFLSFETKTPKHVWMNNGINKYLEILFIDYAMRLNIF